MSDKYIDVVRYHAPGIGNVERVRIAPKQTALPQAVVSTCMHLGPFLRDEHGDIRMVECPPCSAKEGKRIEKPLHACAVHGQCTAAGQADGVATCARCNDKLGRPLLQVECRSPGVGDNLLALAIAEGLRRQWAGTDVRIVSPPDMQAWLGLFAGPEFGRQLKKAPTCFCDVSTTGAKFWAQGKSRVEYWAQEFGTRPVIPAALPLPADAVQSVLPLMGRIVLVPFAAHVNRTWPLERWLELERRLCGLGFQCVVIHSVPEYLDSFASEKLVGAPAPAVAALLQSSPCMVGNDSGMAHLAGMLRRPAVAICGHASDDDIFGLYPTVRMLGSRRVGMNTVTPDQVLQAVKAAVRAGIGDFPADEFAKIVLPRDRWRLPAWDDVYAALWRTVRALKPRRIVEIGTRAGYSAWVMRRALPEASVYAIDANIEEHGGFTGACEHATAINPDRYELQLADSHTLARIPACDLCYVDGDHSEAGALADLELVERSDVRTILVDDVANCREVMAAVNAFVAARPVWSCRFVHSHTGIAVLQKGGA